MHSLHLSNYIAKINTESVYFSIINWIIRLLTGSIFILSGFFKSIDPWGTLYKVQDYLSVLGISIWPNLMIVGVFILCSTEFVIGVLLCLGCFRRSVSWFALAVMCFMLPLSLWIALANPVADCGCFGDAVIISNSATFWKNVGLTIAIIWLVVFNKHAGWLITPALQWIALLITWAYITMIAFVGYNYQPLIDFRPFPIGSSVYTDAEDNATSFEFIYEKDGVKKVFKESDTIPDESSGWVFIDRRPLNDSQSKNITEAEFRLWDIMGEEDVTEEIFPVEKDAIILLIPDLKNVSVASTWKINSLYSWAKSHDMEMFAAVSATPEQISDWINLSIPEYDIYTAEDTSIKMVARGNPAVIYLNNDEIKWKSSLKALDVDDFQDPQTSDNPMSFSRDNNRILNNYSIFYITLIGLLIGLSFLPRLRGCFTRGDKAHHEELSSHDRAVPQKTNEPSHG